MIWTLALLQACTTDATAPTDAPPVELAAVGRCDYVNSFSQTAECKEYLGSDWTADTAANDCESPSPGAAPGSFTAEMACDRASILGECQIDADLPGHTVLVFPGDYGDSCNGLELGCTFSGGIYVPAPPCGGSTGPGPITSVFTPFEQICSEPLAGEPPGATNGEVCTWQAISGATEAGRTFSDYADCEVVISQRPYWAADAPTNTEADDPRLADPEWVEEYDWVTQQVEASACTCCHSTELAPDGAPSGWNIEAGPIWTDSLDDDGMAMMAGWVDSSVFGAFDSTDNNGFSRDTTGLPTTDPARMKAYWEAELFRRGLAESDFATTLPFGGPLYDQIVYEPEACATGIGLDSDGMLNWSGGDARYLYVLEEDSGNPGVPPNLDLPDGTLWRVDVAPEDAPFASGVPYGEAPDDSFQAWPLSGEAPTLTSDETYYLYALADVYVPLTRCLFVAP